MASNSTDADTPLHRDWTVWVALGVNQSIALIAWNRRIFVLNKTVFPLARFKLRSLGLSSISAALWWMSTIAVDDSLALQLLAGALATAISWRGLVLLVNEDGEVRVRQMGALGYYVVTDALWQVHTRLLLGGARG